MTLRGLHWDKIPGDNDNEVAARGILYLLIFQQLGQVIRWSWGYNVLLAPADQYPDEDEGRNSRLERGDYLASDDAALARPLLAEEGDRTPPRYKPKAGVNTPGAPSHSDYESGTVTPVDTSSYDSSLVSSSNASSTSLAADFSMANSALNGRHPLKSSNADLITSFPEPSPAASDPDEIANGFKAHTSRYRNVVKRWVRQSGRFTSHQSRRFYNGLPSWLQICLVTIGGFFVKIWEGMNPPLWAMIAAIIVASIPQLQHLFYDKGTFVNNSLTRAVSQSGGVAVPLILVVLGGNLARNTLPEKDQHSSGDPKFERNLLIASLVSRMVIPFVVMAPILALTAKYVPVSILDDPIFVIVCFLLTGAPTALQLAQICQMNDVYMGVMSKILFQSYVVWYVYQPRPAFPYFFPLDSLLTFAQDFTVNSLPRDGRFGSCGMGTSLNSQLSWRIVNIFLIWPVGPQPTSYPPFWPVFIFGRFFWGVHYIKRTKQGVPDV